MKKPEVLSPAGNLEKLRFAVEYGADAVYLGGRIFNLRERAGNFSVEEMAEGIEYAHSRRKKVYVTLNAFAKNRDFDELKAYVKEVASLKPDSFIVSDLGILSLVKEVAPEVDIHVSTQANVTNYKAVEIFKALGVKRVVLARELSIPEIAEIKERVPDVELEVFVHGAMCMAYSGRCLLSDYLTYRASNKGACSQSCRWKYYVVEEKRPGEFYEIEEDSKGTYIFNSKDLCALPVLPELVKAGVDSFKIEGRVKSAYYVAVVTSVYRKAVDLLFKSPEEFKRSVPFLMEELKKVSHRPYTLGFLVPEKKEIKQHYESSSYIRNYQFLAVYDGSFWNVKNRFSVGEEVEVFQPGVKVQKVKVESIALLDNLEFIEEVHPNYRVKISFDRAVEITPYAILRKRK
ncbi:putative protease [Desulfurobacterium pacificum]|uniref:Protease n=1 Tax=Desulfurobacterium pacificum TaxID=240166 RepID=A0ABY1NVH1_9BACT|nr:U32 family peptidase [Desulfurobacterium pacificum]SMP19028.1 putative protease [Desulfurobacterium pacificum]